MSAKIEPLLWGLVAVLLVTLLAVDAPVAPALANDSGGHSATISTAGSFFVVDTENQWIGLYTQANNLGPRLVSAQNYQYASSLAQMVADSSKEGCENAPGWTVPQTAKRSEEVAAQQSPPVAKRR